MKTKEGQSPSPDEIFVLNGRVTNVRMATENGSVSALIEFDTDMCAIFLENGEMLRGRSMAQATIQMPDRVTALRIVELFNLNNHPTEAEIRKKHHRKGEGLRISFRKASREDILDEIRQATSRDW